ncbi:methionine synthase [Tsukamurella sp. 8F]|uniref:methionine synthase n=1 Tax=unclassified Tsukamurella TaxID=2633480 RepID=UPI0023B97CD0|nr:MULTISPECIES: methionine synthase [unclassified Tsukamurella]MDF0530527.1 methionine synthase [Tsukamurella sp. 8J]MDF0586823.1 methionine synthase [Tsukamurella sp. 8F]
MTRTHQQPLQSKFLEAAKRRVLIGDGAMGTMLQAADLSLDDFRGLEGCNEILNDTRPDVLETIHRAYFEVGADAVETNTFGCNLSNLGDYDIADRNRELAEKGTAIARRVADEFGTDADGVPRFVLGSMGPGTKLPTLGHTSFRVIRDAYAEAALGMLDGGADAFLVETCQDILQTKAAVLACHAAMERSGRRIPIITHVTVETTGTMLLGSEIGAALTALENLGIDMVGLNCATGPAEMSEHLRYLSQHAPVPVSVMPNAGLPVLGANGAEYPLTAPELAEALSRFVTDYGLTLVGGCCGTTPEHIRQVSEAVRGLVPAARAPQAESSISSLYTTVPFAQDSSILMIGERTNSNGSKKFRDAMIAGEWQQCLDIAKDQTRDGAHMLDLNVDYVGRDGAVDMTELASRLATASTLPIMIDSTEPAVIQAGLEHLGGRCAVNSVNYEDGDGPESRFTKIMELVSAHGAAVVGLTIDEEGQARTADGKVRIADRLIADLTGNWGLSLEDIIIDPLVFPISTGQEEVRRDAVETIDAVRRLHEAYPGMHFTVGLSNVSFGLNPAARQVLNSVFLHELTEAGLDSAILHASKILPMSRIPDEQRETALDLVYNRRGVEGGTGDDADYDPLQKLMSLFEGVSAASARETRQQELAKLPLFERLERRIVDGERDGLEADLDEAMTTVPPLKIINDTLLAGMKTVGELFGSGQMQLPFVLQSAEVMKTAVAYLEPHMEKADDSGDGRAGKGRIVLATVKGDVHDIGKNLVDIILSNNGYEVVNIGIKQPIAAIVDAAEDKRADVIGMSGLLVKSTVVMKENLEELNSRGLGEKYPVLLGGAALTRGYVEDDLSEIYAGDVSYARDAFEGLRLMDEIMAVKRGEGPDPDSPEAIAAAEKVRERRERHARSKRIAEKRKAEAAPAVIPERSDVAVDFDVATPPFWGTRIVRGIPVADFSQLLDERALFLGQWGLRGARKGEGPTYEELVETEGRPRLRYWLDRLKAEQILDSAAVVYGYFPAVSHGPVVDVLESPEPDAPVRHSFEFPRQQRGRFLCIADFIRDRRTAQRRGEVDVLPFQLVTMGQPIADLANELFAANAYRDYLEVHGLGVQLTEALAEYWHRRVREELTLPGGRVVADADPNAVTDYFDLKYLGARYSFGYGACPTLEDRAKMVDLLQPDRIGVELSEELQLHPEQSTDAFVLTHPEAKYFNT